MEVGVTNVHHRTGSEGPVFHEVTVIEGSARRRSWSREEKGRIVSESLDPVVSVSAVARRHGLNPNQLYTWRRQFRDEAHRVAEGRGECGSGDPGAAGTSASMIEVILGDVTVRVGAGVEASALRRVLKVVRSLS
jgi:transposase